MLCWPVFNTSQTHVTSCFSKKRQLALVMSFQRPLFLAGHLITLFCFHCGFFSRHPRLRAGKADFPCESWSRVSFYKDVSLKGEESCRSKWGYGDTPGILKAGIGVMDLGKWT